MGMGAAVIEEEQNVSILPAHPNINPAHPRSEQLFRHPDLIVRLVGYAQRCHVAAFEAPRVG